MRNKCYEGRNRPCGVDADDYSLKLPADFFCMCVFSYLRTPVKGMRGTDSALQAFSKHTLLHTSRCRLIISLPMFISNHFHPFIILMTCKSKWASWGTNKGWGGATLINRLHDQLCVSVGKSN